MINGKPLLLFGFLFFGTPYPFVYAEECITVIISGSESRKFWSQIIDGAAQAGSDLGITSPMWLIL